MRGPDESYALKQFIGRLGSSGAAFDKAVAPAILSYEYAMSNDDIGIKHPRGIRTDNFRNPLPYSGI